MEKNQMSVSPLKHICRNVVAAVMLGSLPVSLWAQEAAQSAQASAQASLPQAPSAHRQFQVTDYSRPKGHFPNPVGPYTKREIPLPDFTNSPRIDQLMRDGKVYLSMDDAVALALENNLDIAIQRYNLGIADTDVLRAKSGANQFLGVQSGVVQNTPGGGVGGLSGSVGSGPGGTSAGAGGVGAGSLGLTSTEGLGPFITSFDPILSGTLQFDHNNQIANNIFTGAPIARSGTTTTNFNYQQGLHSGTNLLVGFNNTRLGTNSTFNTYSPGIQSSFQFRLTQHLLQGFGFVPNDRLIRITKNNREITDVAFRLQIITTVDQIENLYWNLVFAFENVRVAQETLAFAQKTLSDNQKQVQIGSLAPIEVVRAQNTVAADQQSLIQAQTNLDLQQLLMKNALSRTLQDPALASAEVIPTTTMALPDQEPIVPTEDLINDALQHRADLTQLKIDLANRDISTRAIKNALLPSLDFFAYYGGSGLGGSQNPWNLTANGCQGFGCSTSPVTPASYSDTLNQLVNSTASDKGMGVTLNVPIRNRQAQALSTRAQLEYRQAQMRRQQLENQIRIEVRNAQFSVTQNRAAVKAAQAAVELAKQSLDAEQKKFNLGASTSTLVLQNQSGLATAESNLVSAMAAYEKAQIELDRATGLLLEHAGIDLGDAEKGEVTHMPKVPYVAPRADVQTGTPPAPQQ
jgi:outer membrane protein TolC